MARFLAIDGDQPTLHVAAASVVRGAVRVEKAISIGGTQAVSLVGAAELGKQLRGQLREAGVPAAPVLVALGRDRFILKEIKYPPVPPEEEAAVVRFQVARDQSEAADSVVIDYFPIPSSDPTGDRKALTVVVRKEILQAYEKLCAAAGLKLLAVVPRPFANAAGVQRAIAQGLTAGPDSPAAAIAVVTRGEKWGELTIARGPNVAFTRSLSGPSLASDTALLGELKRNLAVWAGQNPQSPVQAVYLPEADAPDAWAERIKGLGVPVRAFDPLTGVMTFSTPDARGSFAGLTGLLALQATEVLPVNLLKPREPRKKVDPTRRFLATVLPVLLLLFAGAFAFGLSIKSEKERKLGELRERKKELDERLPKFEEDEKRIKLLNEWQDRTVVWLDEFYDLTSRFPDPKGTQLLEFKAFAREPEKNVKTRSVARMEVKVQTESSDAVKALQAELVRDRFYRVEPWKSLGSTGGGGNTPNRFNQLFELKSDVEHRQPKEYTRKLNVAPNPRNRPVDELKDLTSNDGSLAVGTGGDK